MFLLDTDTVIYSLRGDEAVKKNINRHIIDSMKISAVTLMELYYGAYKSQQVEKNLAKIKVVENTLEVLHVGMESVEVFGIYKAKLEKAGTPLDDFDLILAVTKAKTALLDLIRRIKDSDDAIAITKNGVPEAVLMAGSQSSIEPLPTVEIELTW